jgi:dienelactone hydrolase
MRPTCRGDKDDNLPVTKIETYLAYARNAGAPAPIQTVVYPGAYHAWTVPDLTTARFYPDLVSTKKCPLIDRRVDNRQDLRLSLRPLLAHKLPLPVEVFAHVVEFLDHGFDALAEFSSVVASASCPTGPSCGLAFGSGWRIRPRDAKGRFVRHTAARRCRRMSSFFPSGRAVPPVSRPLQRHDCAGR